MNLQQLAENVPKWYHFPVYQSVWFKGEEIVKGGRDNMFPRMNKIRKEDIKDKVVVDIGCNLGAASFWAIENGAKKCLGFDVVPEGIDVANVIAATVGANCYFSVQDFGVPVEKKGDVAFCFACSDDITKEDVDKQKILLENLKEYDIIYFETHLKGTFPNWNMPTVIREYFKCEYLGETGEGGLKRDFYRLTK
jgi:SAM-dependent methyltransferase